MVLFRRVKAFGRRAFTLYENNSLVANTIIGGFVFALCETIVQVQNNYKLDVNYIGQDYKKVHGWDRLMLWYECVDWKKVTKLGLLGCAENGVLMTLWYKLLESRFRESRSTGVVLLKCFCDQLFFATQQDLLFLGLCAYDDQAHLPTAIATVRKSFLNTWIVDCSVWPLVNFVGFACVSAKVMPAYVTVVSFFWQLYISSVASQGANCNTAVVLEALETGGNIDSDDSSLEELFRNIDSDGSGTIDSLEIGKAFIQRGRAVTSDELSNIMKVVDANSDGEITLDEFKVAVKSGVAKKTMLMNLVHDHNLHKGAKAAMHRLHEHKSKVAAATAGGPTEEDDDQRSRTDALAKASVGGSMLIVFAICRKCFWKI